MNLKSILTIFRGKKNRILCLYVLFGLQVARQENRIMVKKNYHQTKISSKRTLDILIFHLFPDHFRLLNYFLILL